MDIFDLIPVHYDAPVLPKSLATRAVTLICVLLYFVSTGSSWWQVSSRFIDAWGFSNQSFSWINCVVSLFLHGSPMHLIGNLLFLWVFAPALEARLGRALFWLVFLLSGVAGNLFWYWGERMLENSPAISIGASGCIMGVMGAAAILLPRTRVTFLFHFLAFFKSFQVRAEFVFALYFGMNYLLGVVYPPAGNINYLAHTGGFAAGFLLGWICKSLGAGQELDDFSY